MKLFFKRHYRLLLILLIPYLAVMSLFVIRVPYDVSSPAYINDISEVIVLNGEYSSPSGSYYTTSVFVNERVTIFKYLIGKISKVLDVSESYSGTLLDPIENERSGYFQKETSLQNALIAGYMAAGKNITYQFNGQMIIYVLIGHHEKLKVGDTITHINDELVPTDVTVFTELVRDLYKKQEEITLTLAVAGRFSLVLSEADARTLLNCYSHFTVDQTSANPSYQLNAPSSSGPSGGLMQALLVYDALSPIDLANGRKIAGTGTISYDGKVGAIGSIYQKIITAYYNKVDIFLLPSDEENVTLAYQAYEDLGSPSDMTLAVVDTLAEAIEYLSGGKK